MSHSEPSVATLAALASRSPSPHRNSTADQPSTVQPETPASAAPIDAASASTPSLHDDPALLIARLSDASSQTASLNAKLVAAYERIGDQEDALEAALTEADSLRQRVGALEAERAAWEDRIEGGILVEKVRPHARLDDR